MKTEKKGKKGEKAIIYQTEKWVEKVIIHQKKKVEKGKNKANRGVKEKETKDQGSGTYEYYS
jgi:hypothetical protein